MDEGKLLLDLQEADLGIARAGRELEDLPEKKAILEVRAKLRELEGICAKAEQGVKAAEHEVSRIEDEVASVQAKAENEQKKLLEGTVSDPKEVANLSRELDALGRQKDKLEETELAAMEKREEAEAKAAKVRDVVEQGKKKEAALIEQFQKKGGHLKTEAARLTKLREEIAGKLDPDLVKRYEATRAAKHGIGVGVLEQGRCSACRVELPGEKRQALEAGEPITVCPQCHRMLVVRTGGK